MNRAGAPLIAICIALVFASCGGTDAEQDGGTNPAAGEGATQATPDPPPSGSAQGGKETEGKLENDPGERAADRAGPEPGTRAVAAGVPAEPGGDDSVQTFGVEGEVDQREQALATLRTYLNARAAGRWEEACAATSEEFKKQAAQLVDLAPGNEKPDGCPATLRRFLGNLPRSALRESARVEELLSFRVEGDYAYVIFSGARDEVKFIAMANDGGRWKVNTTEPGTFPASS